MSTQSVNAEVPDTDATSETDSNAEVQVTGRNVEVPDHYRVYVAGKLARLERFDRSIYRFDVELEHERNRRQRKNCQHVEITARGRGPVVRGEGCADSFYGAFEAAVHKLENRLRRSKGPPQGALRRQDAGVPASGHRRRPGARRRGGVQARRRGPQHPPWRSRITSPAGSCAPKEHPAKPMTVDDALYEMELVGHDFFLFHDKESDRPSVVYRRHAYDYGLNSPRLNLRWRGRTARHLGWSTVETPNPRDNHCAVEVAAPR